MTDDETSGDSAPEDQTVGGGPRRVVSDQSVDDVLDEIATKRTPDRTDDTAERPTVEEPPDDSDASVTGRPANEGESSGADEGGVSPSPAADVDPDDVPADATKETESSPSNPASTPSIDEVDLSLDDVADVDVPSRTGTTADGRAVDVSGPAGSTGGPAGVGPSTDRSSSAEEESIGVVARLKSLLGL